MSQGYNPQGGQGFGPQGGQGFAPQGGQGFGPQVGYQNSQPYPNIKSPMVWSILSTICCCIPFGIVSIVYAAKVNSLLSVGNFQAAKEAADKAKMWAWIAFGLGLISNAIAFVIQFLAAAAESGGGF